MTPLLELPVSRLTRTPRVWIPVTLWALFALAAAFALRLVDPAASASDALQRPFGAVALPLLAYAIVSAALGGDGLARSIRPLVSFGAPADGAAAAEVGLAVATSAVVCAGVGVLVALLAHGANDPPLLRDAFATAWIALLGGAAYAALFALGAAFGARGGGRVVVLVLDALLGSSDGVVGLVTPRAHVRSLLGGTAADSLPNAASVALLVLLGGLFAAMAIRRARHPAA